MFKILCSLVVLTALLAFGISRTSFLSGRPTQELSPAVRSALECADAQDERAVEDALAVIHQCFACAHKGTHAFAGDALSLGSNLRLLADYVPFTKHTSHADFIKRSFETHVLSEAVLKQALSQTVTSFYALEQAIIDELFVHVRADIDGLPATELPLAFQQGNSFDDIFKKALENARQDAKSDMVANTILLEISRRLSVVIATELAGATVSGAVLGTGAAAAPETGGTSLLVAVIVDIVVLTIYDWWADPTGSLAAKIDEKLTHVERDLIEGTRGVDGLRKMLNQEAAHRSARRRTIITQLFARGPVIRK